MLGTSWDGRGRRDDGGATCQFGGAPARSCSAEPASGRCKPPVPALLARAGKRKTTRAPRSVAAAARHPGAGLAVLCGAVVRQAGLRGAGDRRPRLSRAQPGLGEAIRGDILSYAIQDQADALDAAATHCPDLDLERVAIRGWSFGGFLAAGAVLRRPDVFHAAVAGAPTPTPTPTSGCTTPIGRSAIWAIPIRSRRTTTAVRSSPTPGCCAGRCC